MKQFIIVFLFLSASLGSSSAQDSTSNKPLLFSLGISGGGFHLFERASAMASEPAYTALGPYYDFYDVKNDVFEYLVPDSPLQHSPFYFDTRIAAEIRGLKLHLDINAEHRGASYGVLNTSAMIVYPKYNVSLDTSFNLFDQKFGFGTSFGNFDNLRLYEGLTIYNLDVQAIEVYFKWNSLRLKYHQIGDLWKGIGLNINEIYNLILSYEDIKLPGWFNGAVEAGLTSVIIKSENGAYPNPRKPGLNVSAHIDNGSLRFYGQFGIRDLSSSVGIQRNSALLAGVSFKFKEDRSDLALTAEYRYYGSFFNSNYYDNFVRFRKSTLSGNNSSTIGDLLYPLYFYNRPFSQWAVFTEYRGKSVIGFSLLAQVKYRFYDSFYTKALLDFNYLKATGLPGFLYPFYNIGISWSPADEYSISLTTTNRGMNLNKHYPALNLYNQPQLMLAIDFNMNLLSGGM